MGAQFCWLIWQYLSRASAVPWLDRHTHATPPLGAQAPRTSANINAASS